MLKAYKYRIFPTSEQKDVLANTFGCTRMVYNLALETKNTAYASGKSLNAFDLIKQLVELKGEYTFLKNVPSQALQMSIRNLDNAFTNFFRKNAKFPTFKKKRGHQSFQLPQGIKVFFAENKVFIPKLGRTTCIFSRTFKGDIKTCTISKTPTGKHFISILVENGVGLPPKMPLDRTTSVGIDLGIKDFAITSDGQVFENQRYFVSLQKILRKEQRSFARKKKGSANKEKQRVKVAKIHEKISSQRNDFLHKASTSLIRQYDTICIEDLNVSGMLKNHKLAKHIQDVGWRSFRTMLEYKAEWYGKNIRVIGRFEPSSKMCNVCGSINSELKLSDREWTCAKCSTELDRDVNAAINIRNFAMIKDAQGRAITSEAQSLD